MTELQIRNDEGSGGARILHLAGPLTLSTLFEFQELVRKDRHSNGLIIELAEVPYIDSAGLGALLGAYASCQLHGRQFALTNLSPRVLMVLQVAKVNTLVPIFDTLAGAEGHFTARAGQA